MKVQLPQRKLSLSFNDRHASPCGRSKICSATAQSRLNPNESGPAGCDASDLAQMQAAEQNHDSPAAPAGALINRPTMDAVAYAAAKDAAARATGSSPGKADVRQLSPTTRLWFAALKERIKRLAEAGTLLIPTARRDINIRRSGQQPDSNLYPGRLSADPISSMSMNAFVGYFTQPLF